ncbi:MAG: hypothetical protein HY789_06700 [Deltaproteobacteria bacterium]|nr:hypothetical protein [Deltaproteobacteria bacterium]
MGLTLQKRLGELFTALDVTCRQEVLDLEVCGVTDDSRQVQPGMLFVAVTGDTVDRHRFINAAVAGGCAAVLASRDYTEACAVPVITVADTAAALGHVAAAFFDYPCRRLKMIGITGTNGKTTCTYLLEGLIRATGGSPGVIGTVSIR